MPSVSIFAVDSFRVQRYEDFSIQLFHKSRRDFHFLPKKMLSISFIQILEMAQLRYKTYVRKTQED